MQLNREFENTRKMALDQASIPLTGNLLDDLAMAFRELITKVRFQNEFANQLLHVLSIISVKHFMI